MTTSARAPSSTSNNANSNNNSGPLPYPLYDVILDLSHPGASSSSSSPNRIFYPPSSPSSNTNEGNGIVNCLSLHDVTLEFGPETITTGETTTSTTTGGDNNNTATTTTNTVTTTAGTAKIARFAFPEHDDTVNMAEFAKYQATKAQVGWNDSNSGNLNRLDGYLEGIYSPSVSGSGSEGNEAGGVATGANNTSALSSVNGTDPQFKLPSYHEFSHQLTNGTIIHGHVRRYLPCHAQTSEGGRRDVGRRSARALVLLTRNAGGGGRLYQGILKSCEMQMIVQGGQEETKKLSSDASSTTTTQRLSYFLHSLHQEHVNMCRNVAHAMASEKQVGQQTNQNQTQKMKALAKPWLLNLPLMELGRGHGLFGGVDVIKFAVPPSFLHGSQAVGNSSSNFGLSRNDTLPMLRSLGVPRTLRLLSALMSSQRIILTSNSPSKLGAVSYGALAMLAQGLLDPPSVFVPVLPPGLKGMLASPQEYLIGVLTGPTANYVNLREIPNIGSVVLFDLDNPQQNDEPYFHNMPDPQRSVPDLTRRNVEDMDIASARMVSVADVLFQDLSNVMKEDKKLFWQGAVQEKLGMAAAKGKKAASAAMKKGLKYLKGKSSSKSGKEFEGSSERTNSTSRSDSAAGEDLDEGEDDQQQGGDGSTNNGSSSASLSKLVGKGNYSYEQGLSNEKSEEDARIAFASFFITLLGDLRTYLTQKAPNTTPVMDKPNYLKHRRDYGGDIPGSGTFALLTNFVNTPKFDAFVTARLDEVLRRLAVSEDAPLFALVSNYHRRHPQLKDDFSMQAVRQTARRFATDPNRPGRYLLEWNRKLRTRVSELTSAQGFQGDWGKAVRQLTEDCHECGSILMDTMTVLWTRIQEGKGLQWKKALLALQIFRELLLYGPINAVAEAIDGFASIRILKSYYTEALRGQNSKLVRDAAAEVYALTIDLPLLFARRRECMNKRRLAKDPNAAKGPTLKKETRMIRGINQFTTVHTILRPPGVAAVAPAPRSAPVADLLVQETVPQQPSGVPNHVANAPASVNYSNDLLSLGALASATPSPSFATSSTNSEIGVQQPALSSGAPPSSGNYSNDFLGLSFGDPSATAPQAGESAAKNTSSENKQTTAPDPFSMQAMSQAMPKSDAGPPPSVAASNLPSSQPSSSMQQTPASQSAPTSFAMVGTNGTPSVANGHTMIQNVQGLAQPNTATSATPYAMGSYAPPVSRPIQPQLPSQRAMNDQPPMAMQPNQAQLQQQQQPMSTRNISTFTNVNSAQVPPSLPMHNPMQQSQAQSMMKGPVMNPSPMSVPPMQGGNFPANYRQQPPPQVQQQPWPSNTAAGFTQNQYQQPMHHPPQTAAYGAGFPAMQPTVAPPPQFQQGRMGERGSYSQAPGMPQNANVQKK